MKLTFNKGSVLLFYIAVIAPFAYCLRSGNWPPDYALYLWYGTWTVEAVITARLQKDKRRHRSDDTLLSEAAKYINQDNVEKIFEHYTGVDITPTPRQGREGGRK